MSLRGEILSSTRPERFLQRSGDRKGQHFRVKRGRSGRNVRIYETGDTAIQPMSVQSAAGAKPASIPKSKLVNVDHRNSEVSEAQRGMDAQMAAKKRASIGHGVEAHNDDITEARRAYARRRAGTLQSAPTAASRVQDQRAKNKLVAAERRQRAQQKARNAGGRP